MTALLKRGRHPPRQTSAGSVSTSSLRTTGITECGDCAHQEQLHSLPRVPCFPQELYCIQGLLDRIDSQDKAVSELRAQVETNNDRITMCGETNERRLASFTHQTAGEETIQTQLVRIQGGVNTL